MKKVTLSFLVLATFVITACNFEIPEKVSVKSKAEYNFSIGNIEKSLDDDVKISELISGDALSGINGKVYDYRPGNTGDIQRFLMKIPFMEIPVDIGKYYDESALSEAIQDISFEQTIDIPEISLKEETEISNLQDIKDAINNVAVLSAGTIGYATSCDVSFGSVDESIGLKTIHYSVCDFILPLLGYTEGAVVTISSNGKSASGRVTYNPEFIINGIGDGLGVKIHATDFTVDSNDTKLTFSTPYSGVVVCKVQGNIEYVTGLKSPDIDISSVNADLTIPSLFESCTIKEGYMKLGIEVPARWRGVEVKNTLSTSGALTIPSTDSDTISLDDATITAGDFTVSIAPKISFNSATIYFNDAPKVITEFSITEFERIVLNADDIPTSLDKKDAFPESVYSTVKSIVLGPSGIKGSYVNTFPAGNDITINVDSKFFGFNNKSTSLIAGTSEYTAFDSILSEDNRTVSFAALNDYPNNEFNEWDINLNIGLPGSASGKIILNNVKPKDSYTIGVKLTPVLDWKSISLSTNAFKDNALQDTMSLGINLSDVLNNIPSETGITDISRKINFNELKVYIRAEKPAMDIFDQFKFTGNISIFQGTDATTPVKDEVGEDIKSEILKDGTIGFVSPLPELEIVDDCLITDVSMYDSSVSLDLADIFNKAMASTTGELYVSYDLKLDAENEISIRKQDLTGNDAATISAYALIDIPLSLKIVDDISVDLLSTAGLDPSKDLFQRESASSLDEIEKFLDVIESASIVYKTNKIPVSTTKPIEVKLQLFSDSQTMAMDTNGGRLNITSADVSRMIHEYPYNPTSAKIEIPKNTVISVPRSLSFDANFSIKVVTNGEVEVFGGNK